MLDTAFGDEENNMYSRKYSLLLQEGYLSRSSLLAGLDAIIKSNISDIDRGFFYIGFFQLSIGFERIMKLTLILDYMNNNNLEMIPLDILKKDYNHGIIKLYETCKIISKNYPEKKYSYINIDDFEYNILTLLNDFALKSRYSNLDELANAKNTEDPLCYWWSNVLQDVIYDDVPERKRKKLAEKIIKECDENYGNGFTMEVDFNGNIMTRYDSLFLSSIIPLANPYINWYIIKTLKPIRNLIFSIFESIDTNQKYMNNYSREQIPFMYEFYPFLLLDKSNVINRKKWV